MGIPRPAITATLSSVNIRSGAVPKYPFSVVKKHFLREFLSTSKWYAEADPAVSARKDFNSSLTPGGEAAPTCTEFALLSTSKRYHASKDSLTLSSFGV